MDIIAQTSELVVPIGIPRQIAQIKQSQYLIDMAQELLLSRKYHDIGEGVVRSGLS
jgi:hypothetical protein